MSPPQGFCPNCGRMHDLDLASFPPLDAIPICDQLLYHCDLCDLPGHQSRFCADYTRIMTTGHAEQVDLFGQPSGRTSSGRHQTHLADAMPRSYTTSGDLQSAMQKPKDSKSDVSVHKYIKQSLGPGVESKVKITGGCDGQHNQISVGEGSQSIVNARPYKHLSKSRGYDTAGMPSACSVKFVAETATFSFGDKTSNKPENIGLSTTDMPSASDVRFVNEISNKSGPCTIGTFRGASPHRFGGEISTSSVPRAKHAAGWASPLMLGEKISNSSITRAKYNGGWASPIILGKGISTSKYTSGWASPPSFGEKISTNSVPHANEDRGWAFDSPPRFGEKFSENSKSRDCPYGAWGAIGQAPTNSKSKGAEIERFAPAHTWGFGDQAADNSRSGDDLGDQLSPHIFGSGRFMPGFGEANANNYTESTGSNVYFGGQNDGFATTNANTSANNLGPDPFFHLSTPCLEFSRLNMNTNANANNSGSGPFIQLSPPNKGFSRLDWNTKANNSVPEPFIHLMPPCQKWMPAHTNKTSNNSSGHEGFSFGRKPQPPLTLHPLKEPFSAFHFHEGTPDRHSAAGSGTWTTSQSLSPLSKISSGTEKGAKAPVGTAQSQSVQPESTTAAQSSGVFAIECLCGCTFIADNDFIAHARDCKKIRDRENHLVLIEVNLSFSFAPAPPPAASNPFQPQRPQKTYDERRLRHAIERRQRWEEAQEQFRRKEEETMERGERRFKERQERFWEKQQKASEQFVREEQEKLMRQQEAEQTLARQMEEARQIAENNTEGW